MYNIVRIVRKIGDINLVLKCNIATIRNDIGISQVELSARTGLTVGLISRYENGHTLPYAYNLWKIAIALDCTVDALYEVVENNIT